MKKHSKKPLASIPRVVDPQRLADVRGGNDPIVPLWASGQHKESFVPRDHRRRHR
jgi:hypothetical protein